MVLTYSAVSSFELTGAAAANVDLTKIEAAVAAKAGVPASNVTAAVVVSPATTARRLSEVAAAINTMTTVTTTTKAKDYAAASAMITVLSSADAAADVGSSLGMTAAVGSTAGGVNLQVAAVVVVPEVGQCRLTVSKLVLKAPLVSALEAEISQTAFKLRFHFQVAPLHRGGVGRREGQRGRQRRHEDLGGHGVQGRAVHVDPTKPTLKPPGTKRLKLKYDDVLSNFVFDFTLRRYIKEEGVTVLVTAAGKAEDAPVPASSLPPPTNSTNTTEEEDGNSLVADDSSSARSRVAAPLALIISSAVISVLAAL